MNITEEEAIEVAKRAVCEAQGWIELPEDAVLETVYFSERGRWVLEWKHKSDIYYSEVDRLLAWISDSGEVLKLNLIWKPAPTPEISTNVAALLLQRGIAVEEASASEIKRAMSERVKAVEGIDVLILDYREIKKEVYRFFINEEAIQPYYWYGKIDEHYYGLFDEDGKFVGEMILPGTTRSTSTAGHWYGPGHHPERDRCLGWENLPAKCKTYFNKWLPDTVFGIVPMVVPAKGGGTIDCSETYPEKTYITLDDYEEGVKSSFTKLYACIAHGSCWWFHFVPYTSSTCYTSTEAHREEYGCHGSIEELFENRPCIRLAFLMHCGAMDTVGEGTIEYYFRKGENSNTSIIGLKDTTGESFSAFYSWLPDFLRDIDENRDKRFKDAYDDATDTYPDMEDHIEFTGDPDMTLRRAIQSDICKNSSS